VGEVRLCKLMKMIILCLYDACLKEERVVNKCMKKKTSIHALVLYVFRER
jgi:hypothetical protein